MRKLAILAIVFLIPGIIYLTCNSDIHLNIHKDYQFREINYTISRGDTLWSIAREYCPEDMDIRDYIDRLHISPKLYPGQVITILEEVK